MSKNIDDITLAFAGVCQAAHLAQQLAHQGRCHPEAYDCSLRSLTIQDPPTTLSVYGSDESPLRLGLETLIAVLNSASHQGASGEITRYTLGMVTLERKLSKNRQAMASLSSRIEQLDRQLAHYSLDSPVLISAIAAIYVDVISPLGPRIQITGEQSILQNTQVQQRVRAALLAGIRSAVLWQQVGGGRLHLMLARQKLINQAKSILSRLPQTE